MAYDIVADCKDNIKARYLINDACYLHGSFCASSRADLRRNMVSLSVLRVGRPYISGAAIGLDGQLSVYNVDRSQDVPRKSGCYRCLHPSPERLGPQDSCATNGVLGPVPGVVGSLMAVECLKVAAKLGARCCVPQLYQLVVADCVQCGVCKGEPQCDRLQLYDASDGSFMSVKFPGTSQDCALCNGSIRTMQDSSRWLEEHAVVGPGECKVSQDKPSGAPRVNEVRLIVHLFAPRPKYLAFDSR